MTASHVLHVLRDPALDGPTNMARDEHLLYSVELRPAVVRIYAWDPPTISLGYFQRFQAVERLPADVRDLAVVRRLTGGGAILHDREVTYCVAIDTTIPAARHSPLALYRLVHDCWRAVLAASGITVELAPESFPLLTPRTGPFFCFEKPGCTDLMIAGVKLLGSAQRRLPGRVLQHGSLLLGRRFASHPGAHLDEPAAAQVSAWIDEFVAHLARALELRSVPVTWSTAQLQDVALRRAVYAGTAWTQQRDRANSQPPTR